MSGRWPSLPRRQRPEAGGRQKEACMEPDHDHGTCGRLEGISAVTLATHDMARAVRFYQALGFELCHGGEEADFSSLRAGAGFLNLLALPPGRHWGWWGRVIFRVADVDALYRRALLLG